MKMFSKDFLNLLAQVIKSWQVIAVAVVFIIYVKIVSYVSRGYSVPRRRRIKVKKEKPAPAASAPAAAPEGGGSSNDELGLEEA